MMINAGNMGRASTVPACWIQYAIPAIIGAYATTSMMTRLVILENRMAVRNFSINARGVRTRYTPVLLAPAMKMRVQAWSRGAILAYWAPRGSLIISMIPALGSARN